MITLAIETSCDETASAILKRDQNGLITVLSERISSQVKIHEAYGGIVPELAAREHLVNLPILVDQVMNEAKLTYRDINCLSVTRGPGLKGCLLIGLNFAKGVAVAHALPLIGVNHIEGHIYSPFIGETPPTDPFLALVVSGGHTEIHLVHGISNYELISRTLDDAAGEAFDKSAHLLGLPYPGGAKLAELADRAGSSRYVLPRFMRESDNFSFSGLKTAVLLLVKKEQAGIALSDQLRGELAYAIQSAIIENIVVKLKSAISKSGVKRVVLSGGVAANSALRLELAKLPGVDLKVAKPLWCTDNAAMIGYIGLLRYSESKNNSLIGDTDKNSSLTNSVLARWPVELLK